MAVGKERLEQYFEPEPESDYDFAPAVLVVAQAGVLFVLEAGYKPFVEPDFDFDNLKI